MRRGGHPSGSSSVKQGILDGEVGNGFVPAKTLEEQVAVDWREQGSRKPGLGLPSSLPAAPTGKTTGPCPTAAG